MLVGREEEQARLLTLVGALSTGEGGALVLRGDPGVGKTSLCKFAAESARARHATVIVIAGSEQETQMPFAGLADLVRPLEGHLGEVAGPQRTALAGAVGIGEPAAADPFLIASGLLSLLSAAASSRPRLIVVDDAHWLDSSSAVVLAFTARRIGAEGIGMLFAMRHPAQFEIPGVADVTVGPLPDTAIEAVVRSRAGGVVDASVIDELCRAAEGNPLVAVELLASLTPEQRRGDAPATLAVPPGQLDALLLAPVRTLDEKARRALLVAAVCTSDRIDDVSRAVRAAGVEPDVLARLENQGLLTLDGERVFFKHPLVRSSVERDAGPEQRRAAHRYAATAFEHDLDRRVWHLRRAATGVDDELAASLEAAAARAGARGASAEAATAFEHAAQLSSHAHERATRLLRSGQAWHTVGRLDHAAELLETAARLAHDSILHGQIVNALGTVELWRGRPREARDVLVSEAARLEADDPALAAILLAGACIPAVMSGDIGVGAELARKAHELARLGADPGSVVTADAAYAATLALLGNRAAGIPLIDACEAAIATQPMAAIPPPVVFSLTQALQYFDELPRAAALLEGHIAFVRGVGALGLLPLLLATLAEVDFRMGRWARAYGGAGESANLAEELGEQTQLGHSLVTLALVEGALGREQDCLDHTGRAEEIAAATHTPSLGVYIARARALHHAGLARWPAVIRELEPVAHFHTAMGLGQPSAVQWHPDLIEAYVRHGRRADGEQLTAQLHDAAEATQGVWAQGVTARCQGLLTEDDFEGHFETSIAVLDQAAMPFESARSQLNLGERHRHAGAKMAARAPLRAALTVFDELGARTWANRARSELRATGEHRDPYRPASADLTPAETQVALAVAAGATNREAAAALFLSPKTVENHLSRIYAKLGVRSRTELANALRSR